MAQITVTIEDDEGAVGAGWKLVFGTSGSGWKFTDDNGQIIFPNVPADFDACYNYNIKNPEGKVVLGSNGQNVVAGGNYIFNV